ncbi:hypothetical protein PRZ48_000116 [Zasmidium cellare]|uniref:DUF6590 domain-containing protein n=1 Tax=Zasmidium cellare TaxID=395010 RepID=A0ABR0EXK8_ZASCE|nr:hypothetical protein PRZ48_000116 [Zasmidium cellare]
MARAIGLTFNQGIGTSITHFIRLSTVDLGHAHSRTPQLLRTGTHLVVILQQTGDPSEAQVTIIEHRRIKHLARPALIERSVMSHANKNGLLVTELTSPKSRQEPYSSTANGDWYIEKGRFFFVLNVFANHWTECPIYTYGSRGLHDNMSDALKKEHIGLKPMRISIDQYNQQNEYAPINVRYMQNPNRQLSDKAVIHVTQLRSSNFNTKVEIVAYTDGHAVNRVSSLRTRLGCF